MTPMRRLFMTADAVGGVWSYAMDLCQGLAQAGLRISLAVTGPAPSPSQARQAAAIPGLRLLATGLPLDWTASQPQAVLEAGTALAALARAEGAELVHLNSAAYAASGAFHQPLVITCHSCVTSWWDSVRQTPLPAEFRWRRAQVMAGYRLANRLIAPSAAFAATTARLYDVAMPQVVRNGRAPIQAGRRLALPQRFVFAAGRLWDDAKNLAALDGAASLLDLPVLAAGSLQGPHGTAIALPHLQVLGALDAADMAQCHSGASLFVSPARYEPFGLTVLEAAQAGCPLLLSDLPSFRELWGDAASYLADDTPQTIAAAIRQLLDDPVALQRQAQAARRQAARYSVAQMVEGTLALYRDLPQEVLV